jgi:hypothetical protein
LGFSIARKARKQKLKCLGTVCASLFVLFSTMCWIAFLRISHNFDCIVCFIFYFLEHGSDQFNEFLTLLGDKITLQGWDGFKGGLSVNGDTTGTHSVFGKYGSYNIMFHVSTLMPFTPNEKQQVLSLRFLLLFSHDFI